MEKKNWFLRVLLVTVLGMLLWWALRKAPLLEIWAAIRELQAWQLMLIVMLTAAYYVFATLRWWVIVSAENKHISYWPLLRVRVSVFGVSYYTLGPQVGGEALQVLALQRKYGLTFTHAMAAVLMDKLLEYLVDFLLLAVGLSAVLYDRVLSINGGEFAGSLLLLVGLVAWPPTHLTLLYQKRYPLSALLNAIPFLPKHSKPVRFLRAAERLTSIFCRRHQRRLWIAVALSVITGSVMLIDYGVIAACLNIQLPFWKLIAGWFIGWISLLMPLPGGLGALEASQVYALGKFGYGAAVALSVALVIRGRDMLVGGLGLLFAGRDLSRK